MARHVTEQMRLLRYRSETPTYAKQQKTRN